MPSVSCFKCSAPYEYSAQTPIGRSQTCSKCSSDLRVCKNCRHYDQAARWECREEIQDAVREKERANYCDFFQPREGVATASVMSAKEDLLKKAEALFKKS